MRLQRSVVFGAVFGIFLFGFALNAGKIVKPISLYFVSEHETKLFLFPDRKKEVLKTLSILDQLMPDSSPVELPNSEWIYVKTSSNLAGFVLRKNILAVKKSPLHTLNEIFESQVERKGIPLSCKMDLTDALFALTEKGEFWKDDFLLVRARGAFALKQVVDQMNQEKIKPNQTPEIKEFLKRNEARLLYDFNRNAFYVDSNFFWNMIESSPNTKHADYLAYLAVESMPNIDCNRNLFCELETIRKGKLKFIYFFPDAKYTKTYLIDLRQSLQNITLEPESLACFEDADPSIPSEIRIINRYVDNLPSALKSKLIPYIHILKKECLKE